MPIEIITSEEAMTQHSACWEQFDSKMYISGIFMPSNWVTWAIRPIRDLSWLFPLCRFAFILKLLSFAWDSCITACQPLFHHWPIRYWFMLTIIHMCYLWNYRIIMLIVLQANWILKLDVRFALQTCLSSYLFSEFGRVFAKIRTKHFNSDYVKLRWSQMNSV